VRVVDPRWVYPVDPALAGLAAKSRLGVTVEDGAVNGGAGARIAQTISGVGLDMPTRQLGVPHNFPVHGKVSDIRSWAGLTVPDIGRRIVEWSAVVSPDSEPGADLPAMRRAAGGDGG
jgi:1-deoxy-D-xylulose-5-phosphate synthase